MNTYSYAESNPTRYVDPEGLQIRAPQGTIYRGTGDIAGQQWIARTLQGEALLNYESNMRFAQKFYGPQVRPVCVKSTCDIPQSSDQCSASNPNGDRVVKVSGPVATAPGAGQCTCLQTELQFVK